MFFFINILSASKEYTVFLESHKQVKMVEADTLTVANKINSTIVLAFSEDIRDIAEVRVSTRGRRQILDRFSSKFVSLSTRDDSVEIIVKQSVNLYVDVWVVPATSCYKNSYVVTNKNMLDLIINAKTQPIDVCLFSPSYENSSFIEYGFIHGKGKITQFLNNNKKKECLDNDCVTKSNDHYSLRYQSENADGFYFKRTKIKENAFGVCLFSHVTPVSSMNSVEKGYLLVGEDAKFKCHDSIFSFETLYESSMFSVIAGILFFIIFPILGALSIIAVLCTPFTKKNKGQKQPKDNSLHADDDIFGQMDFIEDDIIEDVDHDF